MRVVAEMPFNCTMEWFRESYGTLLSEVYQVVGSVDAEAAKTKISREKTRLGMPEYSPPDLNVQFNELFTGSGWQAKIKVPCVYSSEYYVNGYQPPRIRRASREMDFMKDRLGIEVQFGKYSFMVYNVCAKMTIFHNLNLIDAGIEIVAVKSMTDEMASGVSYFEQFEWDLRHRGTSNIDIPVLILGVDV